MSVPKIVEPSACAWCSIARRGHGRQYADAAGWHAWEQPSQEQMLARMKTRRLQLAVAKCGALPLPVGGERTLDVVEEELTGVNLALWEEVQAYARLRLALESARRDRRVLRARVAVLEAEREQWRQTAYRLAGEAGLVPRDDEPAESSPRFVVRELGPRCFAVDDTATALSYDMRFTRTAAQRAADRRNERQVKG